MIRAGLLTHIKSFKLAAAVWEDSRTRSTLRYCSSFVVIGLLLLVLLKQEVITEQMLGMQISTGI